MSREKITEVRFVGLSIESQAGVLTVEADVIKRTRTGFLRERVACPFAINRRATVSADGVEIKQTAGGVRKYGFDDFKKPPLLKQIAALPYCEVVSHERD